MLFIILFPSVYMCVYACLFLWMESVFFYLVLLFSILEKFIMQNEIRDIYRN